MKERAAEHGKLEVGWLDASCRKSSWLLLCLLLGVVPAIAFQLMGSSPERRPAKALARCLRTQHR